MTYRLLIKGDLRTGDGDIDVVNPATGLPFERCALGSAALVDQCVAAAGAAFAPWAALGYACRRQHLEWLADALDARREDLASVLTLEQGKPIAQATQEVDGAIAAFRYFAAQALAPEWIERPGRRILQRRVPLGPVAAILPWNYPLILFALRVGPALISGNTVVAKPAPTTPLATLLLGEIAAPILPPGVLNIVTGAGDVGSRLTGHPDIAQIAFTGSTATGRRVMESAAPGIKRLMLELGGNDAAIVLDDADVDVVAGPIFWSAMENAGQMCMATKRVYAPARLYDRLCEALAALACNAIVGDGLRPETQIGPVQNVAQHHKLAGYLEEAHARGTCHGGGGMLGRPGYFIAPTIVRDMPDDSRLVREEQFGPILPVLRYDALDEAFARANDTPYGLAGSVWTADPERGFAVAERLETGMVWINQALDLPFDIAAEGAKQSGFGGDELAAYTRLQVVNAAV
jgi:acyl-CoA reductase-like NAD-dependent aldehyde dehydrogenase